MMTDGASEMAQQVIAFIPQTRQPNLSLMARTHVKKKKKIQLWGNTSKVYKPIRRTARIAGQLCKLAILILMTRDVPKDERKNQFLQVVC
jgi:hypothetical protein